MSFISGTERERVGEAVNPRPAVESAVLITIDLNKIAVPRSDPGGSADLEMNALAAPAAVHIRRRRLGQAIDTRRAIADKAMLIEHGKRPLWGDHVRTFAVPKADIFSGRRGVLHTRIQLEDAGIGLPLQIGRILEEVPLAGIIKADRAGIAGR